jgi:4-amino-4-deoxy-L-arabinose transferase-like glycosyltransferase
LDATAPIRSSAVDEGNIEIPLWSLPLVLVVLYASLFSGLGALGLVGPDEPRYAAIAQAMAETHDWITPRLWGTPWFEKPVLYYWAAGMAMRVFGVSEFAARLPSALGALLAVLTVAWTALRAYGVGAAWYVLLMLPTSVAMIGFSRAATPDMLFAGMLTAAMAVAVEMLQKSRPGPILRIAFGFFLGAAVLAKGPAAVILAGGATLLWTGLSCQWRAPFRFLDPWAIAAFCATALPWYVLCALHNPGFLRDFIWHHNFERYLTPVFQHPQPFWFFGPMLILGILPWLPLLLTALIDAARIRHMETVANSPALFLACWALFPLLFFSFSQSKLPGYILPAIPPTVLLLARSLLRQADRKAKAMQIVAASVGMVFPLLMGIAYAKLNGLTIPAWINPDFSKGIQMEFAAALVCGVLVGTVALRRKLHGAISSAAFATVVLLLLANHFLMPRLDELVSTRPVALHMKGGYPMQPDRVAVFKLPRAYEYGLDYYFQRALPEWTPENTQARFLVSSKQGLEEFSRFAQLENITRNHLFTPVTPDGRIFVVDLALEKTSGK